MTDRKRHTLGFTLVELLLAMAILGILMSAIIAMTSGFLGFSRHVNSVNKQLAQLNDAAGYIALNGQRAMEVIGGAKGGAASIDITSGADTFPCYTAITPDHPNPCIALVVPVVDHSDANTTAAITRYDLLAYRVVPISAWTHNPGLSGGWEGSDTPLMLEYRYKSLKDCTGMPCLPPSAPPAVTLTSDEVPSLVIPNLYLDNMTDSAGNTVGPFEIKGAKEFVLRLRTRGSGQDAQRMVPTDGPIVLDVTLRP